MPGLLRASIGALLVAAFVAALVPVCPCAAAASERGEHACCAPPLSLRDGDDDCCPRPLTLEGDAATFFAAVGAPEVASFAPSPMLAVRSLVPPAAAVAFAPSPPSILRI